MKNLKLIIAAAVLLCSTTAFGQANEIELFKSVYKVEKKAMIMEFLKLSDDEAKGFWPIYESYESERSAIGSMRIELIQKYVESYNTMTDEQADEMMTASFDMRSKLEKLHKTYYAKIKKEMGALRAVQFVQFERLVKTSLDVELYNQLPLVGEFK